MNLIEHRSTNDPTGWFGALCLSVLLQMGCDRTMEDGFYRGIPDQSEALGAQLVVTDPVVYSIQNDNERYQLSVRTTGALDTSWAFLVLDDQRHRADSIGQDNSIATASFLLDRAQAVRAARQLPAPIHYRERLDEGLVADFQLPEAVLAGEPIPVTLTVRKESGPTVGVVRGGRNRGPRNNRFSFHIEHNGESVTQQKGPDFGGLSQVESLSPGETFSVTADLSRWATLTPGQYTIRCQYDGELYKLNMHQQPKDRRLGWDVRFTEDATLTVRSP